MWSRVSAKEFANRQGSHFVNCNPLTGYCNQLVIHQIKVTLTGQTTEAVLDTSFHPAGTMPVAFT